jgi:hypothetical protein
MNRRPFLPEYISVSKRGLLRAKDSALELIYYHLISLDIESHKKPEENRISLWNVSCLKKIETSLSAGWCFLKPSNIKSRKITRIPVNASYISALIGRRLYLLFVFE